MKLDYLAYDIFIDYIIGKIGFKPTNYFNYDFFISHKKCYDEYYIKANSILRKEKLKALNEI